MQRILCGRSRLVRWGAAIAVMNLVWASACVADERVRRDALHRKVATQLHSFVEWLDENDARGYVGEVGWPDDFRGDADEWDALAREWFDRARAHRLWVSGWATGEWWDDYHLAMYEDRGKEEGVDARNSQGRVLENAAHGAGGSVGITVNGGEFGSPIAARRSRFSNQAPGAYNTRYHYDRQGTFDYLGTREVGHVRIPFRWERIQPELGRPLDDDELGRIKDVVGRAWKAGLPTILDVHNYGAYYVEQDGRGLRTPIGSRNCTVADFVDLWRRLSRAFLNDKRVLMYALMAEPYGLPRSGNLSGAKVWERASQRALSAIRANGDVKLVAVPGHGWDAVQVFIKNHADGWIQDPENNFVYEVHHYWDHDHSGDYARSYAAEVDAARRDGW